MLRVVAYAGGLSLAVSIMSAGFVDQVQAKQIVEFKGNYQYGTIIVSTSQRKLFYTLNNGKALWYPVAVGRPSEQWAGQTFVSMKRTNPSWSPTASMRRKNRRLPRYVPPGPKNPLGVRALYLGWTAYRIHGTNKPSSIGKAVSSGCIRMQNEDVVDLYNRVHVGTRVHVIR